jgi:hypothetical protein
MGGLKAEISEGIQMFKPQSLKEVIKPPMNERRAACTTTMIHMTTTSKNSSSSFTTQLCNSCYPDYSTQTFIMRGDVEEKSARPLFQL